MKQPVTIHYTSPGLEPPVFIITSLSDPQWDVIEMDHSKNGEDEHEFTKTFIAEPGQYQYKFRLGPGDWWVFDEHKPTVDDGFGNKNNLLTIKPHLPSKLAEQEKLTPGLSGQKVSIDAGATPAASTPAPLMGHESYFPQPSKLAESAAPTPAPAPLLSHEQTYFPQTTETSKPAETSKPILSHYQQPSDFNDEGSAHPLFPHEAISPDAGEQHHSPLFRHESNGLHNRHAEETSSSPKSRNLQKQQSQVQDEATEHPSLDKFPTDEKGIMDTLRRASGQSEGPKNPETRAVSDGSASGLESVREDAGEEKTTKGNTKGEGKGKERGSWKDSVVAADTDPRPKGPVTPPLTPGQEGKEAAGVEEDDDESTKREQREQEEMDSEGKKETAEDGGDGAALEKTEARRGPLQLLYWVVMAFWQWFVLFAKGKKPVP